MFVARHHDGFSRLPSTLNDYNKSSSPWRGGKGDKVKGLTRGGECQNFCVYHLKKSIHNLLLYTIGKLIDIKII